MVLWGNETTRLGIFFSIEKKSSMLLNIALARHKDWEIHFAMVSNQNHCDLKKAKVIMTYNICNFSSCRLTHTVFILHISWSLKMALILESARVCPICTYIFLHIVSKIRSWGLNRLKWTFILTVRKVTLREKNIRVISWFPSFKILSV